MQLANWSKNLKTWKHLMGCNIDLWQKIKWVMMNRACRKMSPLSECDNEFNKIIRKSIDLPEGLIFCYNTGTWSIKCKNLRSMKWLQRSNHLRIHTAFSIYIDILISWMASEAWSFINNWSGITILHWFTEQQQFTHQLSDSWLTGEWSVKQRTNSGNYQDSLKL